MSAQLRAFPEAHLPARAVPRQEWGSAPLNPARAGLGRTAPFQDPRLGIAARRAPPALSSVQPETPRASGERQAFGRSGRAHHEPHLPRQRPPEQGGVERAAAGGLGPRRPPGVGPPRSAPASPTPWAGPPAPAWNPGSGTGEGPRSACGWEGRQTWPKLSRTPALPSPLQPERTPKNTDRLKTALPFPPAPYPPGAYTELRSTDLCLNPFPARL